ncbi:DUF3012 domain-containing protein [Shewanella psychrotolerans]|uniref:DUF3012 domain-containing protein n=1 Tax=Shewanella psychrotolerans TaxID=2864206 RepID=UPI001C65B46A|nr:DUF3012 domain-containing protein [Shewanella psychrotolerans]QYK01048.1 DUF3012 domain-containing protein [Shewanella psychrotolerans]
MSLVTSSNLKISATVLGFVLITSLSGCAPEVGSEKWCKQMEDKAKGDWTANEAADYAKHCVFK